MGWLYSNEMQSEGVTNIGLRDQWKGLEWIKENIAGFGGDPDNITIVSRFSSLKSHLPFWFSLSMKCCFLLFGLLSPKPSAPFTCEAPFTNAHSLILQWGQSAGAFSVGKLILAYGGDNSGLFQRAIMASGQSFASHDTLIGAQTIYDDITNATDCHYAIDSLQCLRDRQSLTTRFPHHPMF